MDSRQVTELLECPVCFKPLDQTCKVLPCQHTFCRLCLREIVEGSNEFRCPECRILVEKDVDDLPANIFLVRLLESLKLGEHRKKSLDSIGPETRDDVSDKDIQKLCTPRTQKQAGGTVRPSVMHAIPCYDTRVRSSGMQSIPGAGKVPCAWRICSLPPGDVHEQHPEPGGPEGPNQGLQGMRKSPQAQRPGGMPAQRPASKSGRNGRKQRREYPLAVSIQLQEPVQQAISIPGQEPLTSRMLAAASPQEQKQIIGERLYPLIHATHPDQAGKITGMLLEIDNAELLNMLESREALAAKTQEAVSVLRMHRQKEIESQRVDRNFGQNGRKQRRGHPVAVSMQPQPVQKTICIHGQESLNLNVLAAASPQEQKQIIGERLYPLVRATHPDQAGKITGMLLEIDNAELLNMLESREALAAKTQEAVSVLRMHRQKEIESQRVDRKFGQNGRKQRRGHLVAVSMQPQPVQNTIFIHGQEPLNLNVLAAASPQEQKQIIGERLYPLVRATHPDQAGKITGMLLEIDNAELLNMLESREALAAKTQEAVSVLRMHRQKEIESQRVDRKFGQNGRKQRRGHVSVLRAHYAK
ncbi:uncharacterized protein [Montipora foliosa]|uniref:uncharacterized protein n=1 Tax=Montipora foliosa TaxID=591990 RepID=UPI0035F13D43